MTPLFIDNREVEAKVESCFEIAHEDLKVEQLMAIFNELLSCYHACYITKMLECWTIIKSDDFYFLFDPSGIEVPGKKNSQARATLYRFDCLEKLLQQLLECICSEKSNDKYQVGGILTNMKENEVKPQLKPKTLNKNKAIKKFKAFSESKHTPVFILRDLPQKLNSNCQPIPCCEQINCMNIC